MHNMVGLIYEESWATATGKNINLPKKRDNGKRCKVSPVAAEYKDRYRKYEVYINWL